MSMRPHYSNNSLGKTGTTQEDVDDFEEDRFDENIVASIKASQDQYDLVTNYTRKRLRAPSSKNIGVELDQKGSCHYGSSLDQHAMRGYSRELNTFGTNVSGGGYAGSVPNVLDLGMTEKQKKQTRIDLKNHLLRDQVNACSFYGNSRNLGMYHRF